MPNYPHAHGVSVQIAPSCLQLAADYCGARNTLASGVYGRPFAEQDGGDAGWTASASDKAFVSSSAKQNTLSNPMVWKRSRTAG